PAVDFSILGNLYNSFQQSQQNEQAKQLNDLAIAKRQADLAQEQKMRSLFTGGLPMKGNEIDYNAVAQAMERAGAPPLDTLSTLRPDLRYDAAGQVPAILQGGTQPAPPVAPVTAPRTDLPPTANSPQGNQAGSVMDLVAAKYGDASADTGRV